MFISRAALAEEGGSGHYQPGSMASFIDGVPPKETFLMRLNVLRYDASVDRDVPLPIGGRSTLGADAEVTGYGLTFLWRPPLALPEGWSYAMSATIPYLSMKVAADITAPTPGGSVVTGRRADSIDAIGDVLLMPLMLNYIVDPDFNVNFRVTAYAPTGDFEVGRLANTGKNFWSIEPTLALMYFGQKNGIEASLFTGVTFNQENNDTRYKSGTQFHLDGTLAQHFPLGGGLAGAGVSGFYYKQVTGDSGAGATFGDFKAKTIGAGPVISYISKIAGHDLIAELKWLHEFETERRLKGDIVFFKLLYKFY